VWLRIEGLARLAAVLQSALDDDDGGSEALAAVLEQTYSQGARACSRHSTSVRTFLCCSQSHTQQKKTPHNNK
jgi:hypothetical protein